MWIMTYYYKNWYMVYHKYSQIGKIISQQWNTNNTNLTNIFKIKNRNYVRVTFPYRYIYTIFKETNCAALYIKSLVRTL